MTKNDRIAMVRKAKGYTLEKFGSLVGLKKSALSHIENGRNAVSERLIKDVAREFSVSEDWLRDGIGGDNIVFLSDSKGAAAKFAKDNNLTNLEAILIEEYLNLEPDEKTVFRNYLKAVLKNLVDNNSIGINPSSFVETATPKNPAEMTREGLHADMDTQIDAEESSEKSQALRSGSEDIADEE